MANYFAHYLDSASPAYKVMNKLQYAAGKGKMPPNLDRATLASAKEDIERIFYDLDLGSYPFAESIATHLFGKQEKRRIILLVKGNFYGMRENIIGSVLPIDVTEDFEGKVERLKSKKGREDTIDDLLGAEAIEGFLAANREELRSGDFTTFGSTSSRFFYFREGSLDGFINKSGKLDVFSLAPYVSETNGYLGIKKVDAPTLDEYLGRVPMFTSHRLKTSSVDKIKKDLEKNETKPLGDLAAHNLVLRTKEDVWKTVGYLQEKKKIGESEIEMIDGSIKDFLRSPRKSAAEFFKVYLRVNSPNVPTTIRELHLHTLEGYHNMEINKKHSAHHSKSAGQKRISVRNRARMAKFEHVLVRIIGKDEIPFTI